MNRLSLAFPLLCLPLAASAQTLFTENFNDGAAVGRWSYNSALGSSDGPANNTGNEANYAFDYSTVGIASAPRSGGNTVGLKMQANVAGGVFTGMSTSPLGQSFSGDYTLTFDAWMNFVASGNGSTQLTMGGIGSAPTTAQFPGGTFNALGFAATGDGGSASDYRGYGSGTTTYAAPAQAQNNTDPFYTSRFNGAYPAAQTALFPTQTGTVASGALGMKWYTWIIAKTGTTVSWTVRNYTGSTFTDTLLATTTNAAFSGSDIFLGQFDFNSGSSTDANNLALNFGLIDNVVVSRPVPEPASFAALGVGALAVLRRRKRG